MGDSAQLKMIFLGTSSAVPTGERGLSSVALIRNGEVLLFDAGEGVQRAFSKAGIGLNRRMKIFITHLHGDHCVGLLGLLQTMSMINRDKPLDVYGPRGIVGFVKNNIESLKFTLTFPLRIDIVREGVVVKERDYIVKSCKGKHFTTNYAYLFEEQTRPGVFNPEEALKLGVTKGRLWSNLQNGQAIDVGGRTIYPSQVLGPSRPGRKIGISGDTRPTLKLRRFFSGADVLVFDSTYFQEHEDMAKENLHSTAGEAAELAVKAGVRKLVLTHFSSRYNDVDAHLSEASSIHPDVVAASDFMLLEIPYPTT